MSSRVVITGMGIVAPNGIGLASYEDALRRGVSGIRFRPMLEELKFGCQVGGIPQGTEELRKEILTEEELMAMNDNMVYATLAGLEAWQDAGLELPDAESDVVHWDTGAIVGTGITGLELLAEKLIPMTKAGKVKRMGSACVEQTMGSSVSATLSGRFRLGNQVSSNSSACNTGTEAIIMAAQRIRAGLAKRMIAGGSEEATVFNWAGFDSMRVLNRKHNETPERASRPMSASASGFIPGSGAGILVLEDLETARTRGARIYAEIIGDSLNSGGQAMGGSMTAPNSHGVQRCIRDAVTAADLDPRKIDAINGHLTGTFADPLEIRNWSQALETSPETLPWVQATKSLIGHGLGAAGAMECVAGVLQLARGFVHGSLNAEDIHPDIAPYEARVVRETRNMTDLRILAKASFGFGDVNGCVLFEKWDERSR